MAGGGDVPRVLTGRLSSSGTLADFAGHSILNATDVDLASTSSLFRVLLVLSRGTGSGLLGVKTPEQSVAISVHKGHIIKTSSDQEDEDEAIAITILDRELMPRERLVRAAEHAENTGESLARSLFSLQLMSAKDMVRTFRAMHQRHVSEAMGAAEGSWTFASGAVLGGRGLEAGPTKILILRVLNDYLRGRLRKVYAEELDSVLQPLRRFYLRVPESYQERREALGFNRREVHSLETLLDGARRLDDIIRSSVMSKNGISRMLFAVANLGMVEFLEESTRPFEVETQAMQLEVLLGDFERRDFFDRLGAHWSSSFPSIRASWEDARKEFGPGGTLASDPALAALCAQIWVFKEEAWETLKHAEPRRAYRAKLVEPYQIRFSADLLFAQGRTAELQRRFEAARELYETAVELHPTPQYSQAIRRLDAHEHDWMKKLRDKERGET